MLYGEWRGKRCLLYLYVVALSNTLRDGADMSHWMFVMFDFLSKCNYTVYQYPENVATEPANKCKIPKS